MHPRTAAAFRATSSRRRGWDSCWNNGIPGGSLAESGGGRAGKTALQNKKSRGELPRDFCARSDRRAIGRGAKTRTLDTRFWRPLLYQLSYTPKAKDRRQGNTSFIKPRVTEQKLSEAKKLRRPCGGCLLSFAKRVYHTPPRNATPFREISRKIRAPSRAFHLTSRALLDIITQDPSPCLCARSPTLSFSPRTPPWGVVCYSRAADLGNMQAIWWANAGQSGGELPYRGENRAKSRRSERFYSAARLALAIVNAPSPAPPFARGGCLSRWACALALHTATSGRSSGGRTPR